MRQSELREFLDEKSFQYNQRSFIETDPIQIPHLFSKKEDVEISGFLTATIAWGNRKAIISNATRMMALLDNSPYDFVIHHSDADLKNLERFVHRTFNGSDLITFVKSLKVIYSAHGGIERIFENHRGEDSLQTSIHRFRNIFFQDIGQSRSHKHLSDPLKNSAAKRVNMFLRWMVRNDQSGVDFGLWKNISPSILSCPLDVHSGNVARKLGLLHRKQNDATAVSELDLALRKLDPSDPVKYDFALFGLGAFEKF